MIESVALIGKYVRNANKKDKIEELIQNEYKASSKYPSIVIKIILNEDPEGNYSYFSISTEDLKENSCRKMLYRSFGGNSINPSPTAQYISIDTTFDKKIVKFFEKVSNDKKIVELFEKTSGDSSIGKSVQQMAKNIQELLKENSQKIKEEIQKEMLNNKKFRYFLTVVFKKNNKELFVGDIDIFKTIFLWMVDTKEKRHGLNKGICSICKNEGIVLGGVSPYAFFNTDKDGFLVGFNKKESYKNFPICQSCVRDLETGRLYIDEKLEFEFVKGLRYKLIPQPLINESSIENFLFLVDTNNNESASSDLLLNRMTTDENELLFTLKNCEDNFALNFLFIETLKSAEKIMALINDVLPSRLSIIYKAKADVDKTFNSLINSQQTDTNSFTFSTIRQFFYSSEEQKQTLDLNKYFLQIVDAIFKRRTVNKDFITNFIMKKIRYEYIKLVKNNKNMFKSVTIDGLKVLYFLNKLGLLEVFNMEQESRTFDRFFNQFEGLAASDIQKGLFLLGAATQVLLNVQREQRGSQPFLNQLKGLKMDERDFKELLPKVHAKLYEYDSYNRAKKLLEEASYYLARINKWNLSTSEMNFYFALGMNLCWEVLKFIKSEEV